MRESSPPWPAGKHSRRRRYKRRYHEFNCPLRFEFLEPRYVLAVITVDTLTDETDGSIGDGDISLRDALAAATAGDTINFDDALDGGTILLTLGELAVRRSMSIDASALPQGLTIDAAGNDPTPGEVNGDGSRIFRITDGDVNNVSEVAIRGLTLTGGDVIGDGGAIQSNENLAVTDSTITGNSARGDGSGISTAGGGNGDVDLTISSSNISGNFAGGDGGGIRAVGYRLTVSVDSSTITGNSGKGIGAFGSSFARVTVNGSTITGNSGIGIEASGSYNADVTVSSSTITDNTGNGIEATGGQDGVSVTVSSSTISGNLDGGIEANGVYVVATISSSTITGNLGNGIDFSVLDRAIVTVRSSTITDNSGNGIVTDSREQDVDLTVLSSTITGNMGDGIGAFGSFYEYTTTVRVLSSTITGNSGDGIRTAGRYTAATISTSTITGNSRHGINAYGESLEMTVRSSTITDNSGHGIDASSSYFEDGAATVGVISSTITDNSGRGIHGSGGVPYLTITSSTIADNADGGIAASGKAAEITINSSTISGNSAAGDGGGILLNSETSRVVTIQNSIVAGNLADGMGPDLYGAQATSTSVRFSLIGDKMDTSLNEAQTPDDAGNLIGNSNGGGIISPLLGPLANNGGPTPTHALLPGSPAINMGDPNFRGPPANDQRGAPFVRVSDGRVDMGAFESQIAPVDFNSDSLLNCADVDELVTTIVEGNDSQRFDLSGDGVVDQTDLDVWLSLAGSENLPSGRPYLLGDANLDGKVDSSDLNKIGLNWRQNVSGWCQADFDASGRADAEDLNVLAINWRRDSSGEIITTPVRVPRAPLAKKPTVAAITTAPPGTAASGFASKLSFVPSDAKVESAIASDWSSYAGERHLRWELLRAFTGPMRGDSISYHPDYREEQFVDLVDVVLRRW